MTGRRLIFRTCDEIFMIPNVINDEIDYIKVWYHS